VEGSGSHMLWFKSHDKLTYHGGDLTDQHIKMMLLRFSQEHAVNRPSYWKEKSDNHTHVTDKQLFLREGYPLPQARRRCSGRDLDLH
jgi:hypothetical protein